MSGKRVRRNVKSKDTASTLTLRKSTVRTRHVTDQKSQNTDAIQYKDTLSQFPLHVSDFLLPTSVTLVSDLCKDTNE